MKNQLLNLMSRVIELLTNCGWADKATWFSELENSIANADPGSQEFNEFLTVLDNALSGMGSFSDLPLRDKTGKMSEQEARNIQWELVELLGDVIEELRDTPRGT